MIKAAAALTTLLIGAGVLAAPPAHADIDFVRCSFAVAKPHIYDQGGQQYVGARMAANNCSTDQVSTPVTFELDIAPSTQQPDGSWAAYTNHYTAVVNVSNGGSYAVDFPNDGRLIPLLPGGYLASGTATSTLPGFEDPRHINAEAFTYGVPTV